MPNDREESETTLEYLVWSLPFVVVAALIATGRATSTTVGLSGLVTALMVAMAAPPHPFGARDALGAIARGGWLALLVGAVILGGLFFREAVSEHDAVQSAPVAPERRRKQLYTTCFLIGPFAEGATGFGVGQVTIAPLLNGIGLAPLHAILFGLFSQMMVSWGAMANGTIVGAQLSGIAPTDLGVHSALLTVPLLIAWLGLFWRIAAIAKIPGTPLDFVGEAVCTIAAAGFLVAANALFGPEVAALAALGPLIVARFLMDGRPDRARWRSALRVGPPYVALIAILMATRAIAPVNEWLRAALAVQPFADGPTWFPLLHPGSWLLVVGLATTIAMRRPAAPALARAWTRGRKPILTIGCFLAMAQVMATSGLADSLAMGLRSGLGPLAVLATPLFAAAFGFLTGSSNAANGLLMPAQIALARDAALSLPWLGAIQNTAAAALTMLSPVRVAVGCALVGKPDLERTVYLRGWLLGAAPLAILVGAAALLLVR